MLNLSGFSRRAWPESPLQNHWPCYFQKCSFSLWQKGEKLKFAKVYFAKIPFPEPSRKTRLPFTSEAAEFVSGTLAEREAGTVGKRTFPEKLHLCFCFPVLRLWTRLFINLPHSDTDDKGDRSQSDATEKQTKTKASDLRCSPGGRGCRKCKFCDLLPVPVAKKRLEGRELLLPGGCGQAGRCEGSLGERKGHSRIPKKCDHFPPELNQSKKVSMTSAFVNFLMVLIFFLS